MSQAVGRVPRCLSARPGRPAQQAHLAEPTKPVICRKWSSMWKWSSKNSASSAAIWPTGIHSACRASSSARTAGRGRAQIEVMRVGDGAAALAAVGVVKHGHRLQGGAQGGFGHVAVGFFC